MIEEESVDCNHERSHWSWCHQIWNA